jgi:hypothetical protein
MVQNELPGHYDPTRTNPPGQLPKNKLGWRGILNHVEDDQLAQSNQLPQNHETRTRPPHHLPKTQTRMEKDRKPLPNPILILICVHLRESLPKTNSFEKHQL